MADVDVSAATHHEVGAEAAAPPTLVPACAICIGVSACVSSTLAYYATLGASLVALLRAMSPDRVDAALAAAGAYARRRALVARAAAAEGYADLEADLRRVRDAARGHPATAPAYAAVAGYADKLRRRAETTWSEHRGAASAAWLVLRMIARAVRLAATVVFNAVYEEVKLNAPSALEYLRGLVDDTCGPPPSKEGDEAAAEAEAASAMLADVVYLVGICFFAVFGAHLLSIAVPYTGQIGASFFAVTGGLLILATDDDRDWDDYDETDDTTTLEGDEAVRAMELQVRESWDSMWAWVIEAFFIDAFLLHVKIGPQPVVLALLALCNFGVIHLGRQIQASPDGGDAEESVERSVAKWRRAATAVFAASSVKVLAIYLTCGVCLAAPIFLVLCALGHYLLAEDGCLSAELDYFADYEDDDEDIAGAAEDEADEARPAERSGTSTEEDAGKGTALSPEEHCGSSEEHVEEKGQGEVDYNGGSGMADGWDLVEADPEMPVKANSDANSKLSGLFSWK